MPHIVTEQTNALIHGYNHRFANFNCALERWSRLLLMLSL
jgi:hypothetical protein